MADEEVKDAPEEAKVESALDDTQGVTEAPTQEATAKVESALEDKAPEYKFKLPDGVNENASVVNHVTDVAEKFKLTQEQAQELLNSQASYDAKAAAESDASYAQAVNAWAKEAKADGEIGGNEWRETIRRSNVAIDKYGTSELRDFLKAGVGNHPEVIRFLSRVGATLVEDKMLHAKTFVKGVTPGNSVQSKLYPNSSMVRNANAVQ